MVYPQSSLKWRHGTSSQIGHADGHVLRESLALAPHHPACGGAAKPWENMGSSPAKNGGETKQNGGLTNTKTVV